MEIKIYGLTQSDCKTLATFYNNEIDKLALLLWNKKKAKSFSSAILKAKKIVKFSKIN